MKMNNEDILKNQYFLINGMAMWGYFPWKGGVIVVGWDGSRPDSLERIRENSVCELQTVEAARVHWNARITYGYSPMPPYSETLSTDDKQNSEMLRGRTVVFGLACRFREENQNGFVSEYLNIRELMHDLYNPKHTPSVNRTQSTRIYKTSNYEEYNEEYIPPTNYAMEA